jgi:hypothetical protein
LFEFVTGCLASLTEERSVEELKEALVLVQKYHTMPVRYETFAAFYAEVERIDALIYGSNLD